MSGEQTAEGRRLPQIPAIVLQKKDCAGVGYKSEETFDASECPQITQITQIRTDKIEQRQNNGIISHLSFGTRKKALTIQSLLDEQQA